MKELSRDATLQVVMTSSEAAAIKDAAEAEGLSVSTFARRAIIRYGCVMVGDSKADIRRIAFAIDRLAACAEVLTSAAVGYFASGTPDAEKLNALWREHLKESGHG